MEPKIPVAAKCRVDLCLFFIATFVLSWAMLAVPIMTGASGPWVAVGTSGPTLVALLLWIFGRRRKPAGVRIWRSVGVWLLPALLFGAVPGVIGAALAPAIGGPALDLDAAAEFIAGVGGPVFAVLGLMVAGPLAEEFGWRGYAQPRMLATMSPVRMSLWLGLAWSLWHLPLFWLPDTVQAGIGVLTPHGLVYLVVFVPLSYLAWFVSVRLRGGVFAAITLHFGFNGAQTLLKVNHAPQPAYLAAGMVALSAAAVYIVLRRKDCRE